MNRTFCFIGDPGPDRAERLQTIRAAGLTPVRINPCTSELEGLEIDPPCALVVGAEVVGRDNLVAEIRQQAMLDRVPIIARVRRPDSEEVERALADGADDILVDGAESQFEALLATFAIKDTWSAVRAPSGLVLLADENRQERIRLGHVLRRGGFDIRFAADLAEMERALLYEQPPRAVVTSAKLPGGSLSELLRRVFAERRIPSPWVIVNANPKDRAIAKGERPLPKIVFDNGSDPERLTFLMNELLAPVPPEVRQSPRLLYEAMIEFTHQGSSERFYGYTYNVNAGGLFVRTLTPPPRQSRIEVRFRPPCGRGQVIATAQVVWLSGFDNGEPKSSPAGMGIQFVDWAPADRAGFESGYRALLEMHGDRSAAAVGSTTRAAVQTVQPGAPTDSPWSIAKRVVV